MTLYLINDRLEVYKDLCIWALQRRIEFEYMSYPTNSRIIVRNGIKMMLGWYPYALVQFADIEDNIRHEDDFRVWAEDRSLSYFSPRMPLYPRRARKADDTGYYDIRDNPPDQDLTQARGIPG